MLQEMFSFFTFRRVIRPPAATGFWLYTDYDGFFFLLAVNYSNERKLLDLMNGTSMCLLMKTRTATGCLSGNDSCLEVVYRMYWLCYHIHTYKKPTIYAPWCGDCQALGPKYNKLARHLQGIKSLVIAKMDGTTNEHPRAKAEGFPMLLFYPPENKSSDLEHVEKLAKEIIKGALSIEGVEAKLWQCARSQGAGVLGAVLIQLPSIALGHLPSPGEPSASLGHQVFVLSTTLHTIPNQARTTSQHQMISIKFFNVSLF